MYTRVRVCIHIPRRCWNISSAAICQVIQGSPKAITPGLMEVTKNVCAVVRVLGCCTGGRFPVRHRIPYVICVSTALVRTTTRGYRS